MWQSRKVPVELGRTYCLSLRRTLIPKCSNRLRPPRDSVSVMQELHLSEEDDDDPLNSDDHGEGGELDETKQYDPDQRDEEAEASGSKPDNPTADPPTVPGTQTAPIRAIPSGDAPPAKPATSKGKGPNHEGSGKVPTPKVQLSAAALGVQDRARSTLFDAATLAQAIGSEEDTVRRLENYTGLLTGLQRLVGIMASGL